MDAVHIKAGRWKYLIVARDDFSGWAETVGLTSLKSKNISEWFTAEWIYRYGVPKEVTVDGGAEFKKELQSAMKRVGTKLTIITPYYPEAQGMVERGHKEIKDALTKMCGEDGKKWKDYLPLVTFADRISTKRTTGYSPYELQFGQLAILPIDQDLGSFLTVDWDKVKTTAELIKARAEQLESREDKLDEAFERMRKTRETSVRYWDKRLAHRLRKPLNPGDLVLVYNKALETQWGKLFTNKWNGPYKIVEQINQGPYKLSELDGTILTRRYAASHIKRFYPRGESTEEEGEELDSEEEEQEESSEEGSTEAEATAVEAKILRI
jgi:hypothetical protein